MISLRPVTVSSATNDDGSAGLTGHAPPLEGAQGFGELVAFLEADHDDGSYTPPAVRAIEEEDAECPSSVAIARDEERDHSST